jgi:hypothetical protein
MERNMTLLIFNFYSYTLLNTAASDGERRPMEVLIRIPFTAGCKTFCVTGRSSDSSRLLTLPILSASGGSQTVVFFQKPRDPRQGPDQTRGSFPLIHGFTAAGTVADSNGIPFSFLRLGRMLETNDG